MSDEPGVTGSGPAGPVGGVPPAAEEPAAPAAPESGTRPPEAEEPPGASPPAAPGTGATPPTAGTLAAAEAGAAPSAGEEPLLTVVELEEEPQRIDAQQLSLARRLRQPRAILSIVIPLVLLVFIVINVHSFDFAQLVSALRHANWWLLLLAFAIYYIGFPLRGYRWRVLLRGAGIGVGGRDSTEILFISWMANCVVPAKLGDVYRGYLLGQNYPVSLSATFGTIFIERVFDLFAIVLLGLAAAYWSFRTGMPRDVQIILVIGLVVVGVLAVGLFTLRNFGRRIIVRLPWRDRLMGFYDRFEQGVFSIDRRSLPLFGLLTFLIWSTEAWRLFFVIAALGFSGLHLGISGVYFVALAASLLTAIPLTPAGLGVVEAGIIGILTLVYGVSFTDATAIALVDRAISVLSVIILGGVVYVLSKKTKAIRAVEAQPAT